MLKNGWFHSHNQNFDVKNEAHRKIEIIPQGSFRLYAKTLLNVIFPQGIPLGVFQGDFGMLKQTLRHSMEKKSRRLSR